MRLSLKNMNKKTKLDRVQVLMVCCSGRSLYAEAEVDSREGSKLKLYVSQHIVGSETMSKQRKLSVEGERSRKKLLENETLSSSCSS